MNICTLDIFIVGKPESIADTFKFNLCPVCEEKVKRNQSRIIIEFEKSGESKSKIKVQWFHYECHSIAREDEFRSRVFIDLNNGFKILH